MTDPLAEKRGRLLAACADLPRLCRLVEVSEGDPISRKLTKLSSFGTRYLTWAAARAGLEPGEVEFPLFWGRRLVLPWTDDADFTTFYLAGGPGGPEYKLVRWFIRNLKEDDVFYDVGANYGFYTQLASELLGEAGQLHAFEPLPEIHEWLVRNRPRLAARLVDAALWDATGEATLYRHRLSDAFNTLEKDVTDFDPTRGPERTEVRTIRLDDYVAKEKAPTVMKIDVEGGEKRLLAGAEKTIRAARPAIAMEAWAGEGGRRFTLPAARLLSDWGYEIRALDEAGGTSPLDVADVPAFLDAISGWDNLIFTAK